MEGKTKKKKKWIRPRHTVVRFLLGPAFHFYSYLKYGVHIKPFREQKKRPYLILFNHQTAFDQFFVGVAFRSPVYYMATEDLFSKGWISSVIRYLVAPIPIKKQTTDIKAILTAIRVAREGGTIAIAPEGNRTYDGKTVYMSPAIAPLARKLGLPIALFRIEGGYGVHPRWSDVVRKGKMSAYVSRVIEPEEYAKLSDDELFSIIESGLNVNEANADHIYRHKKRAEYLERAAYVCPKCGLSRFESHGDVIECMTCHARIHYTATTELRAQDGEFPFEFFHDWYEYQKEYVSGLDLTPYTDTPMYEDRSMMSRVIPYVKKQMLCKSAEIKLYGDRMTVLLNGEERNLPFDEVSAVAVLGKNKLNVYHGEDILQFKGDKRFNALKYVHIYHHYKNVKKGDADGKFLGL